MRSLLFMLNYIEGNFWTTNDLATLSIDHNFPEKYMKYESDVIDTVNFDCEDIYIQKDKLHLD